MLSIVVPTFNEAENLPGLVEALAGALDDVVWELIIADDNSEDDTSAVCDALSEGYPIRLLKPEGRDRDLSLSVVDGIRAATQDLVLVMDADLSHPVEQIPVMLEAIANTPGAFVLGSRYVSGGSFDRDWSVWRFLNSHFATLMARPLIKCSDPMSGFFLFQRHRVNVDRLRPIGYKIGLEIMVRGDFDDLIEIPINFKDRAIGQSKMNMAQQIKYLRHLRRLYLHKYGNFAEFIHFGAVGASGFVVDIIFYYGLQYFGIPHLWARAASFWPAVSWNWALNRLTTFGERERRPRGRQWLEFVGMSLVGFAINWGVYLALTTRTTFFDNYRILALVAGIGCASFFNFAMSTLFVYNDKRN